MSVSVEYKGNVIAELADSGTKTLKTSGMYCEGDIVVNYTASADDSPVTSTVNFKTYEVTLAKASGWVLLTTLDADVLEHIDDASLVVSLTNVREYVYEWYSLTMAVASNFAIAAYNASTLSYGMANRQANETTLQYSSVFYPANNTGTSTNLGGYATFRVSGNKYYVLPGDGFVAPGTYRLTFTW